MRSGRDHHKVQADMREIEVKRMKRVETSHVTKGKEVAISILNQSGGKENNPLTNRAEETSPTAIRMTPRQCESPRLSLLAVMLKLWSRCSSARVTPVLRVRGAKRPTAVSRRGRVHHVGQSVDYSGAGNTRTSACHRSCSRTAG